MGESARRQQTPTTLSGVVCSAGGGEELFHSCQLRRSRSASSVCCRRNELTVNWFIYGSVRSKHCSHAGFDSFPFYFAPARASDLLAGSRYFLRSKLNFYYVSVEVSSSGGADVAKPSKGSCMGPTGDRTIKRNWKVSRVMHKIMTVIYII